MKLKHLEENIQRMEESLNQMKGLTKEIEAIDDQVDLVRTDLKPDPKLSASRDVKNIPR